MTVLMTVTADIHVRTTIDIEKMARQLPPKDLSFFRGGSPADQFYRLIQRLSTDIEIEVCDEAPTQWHGDFKIIDEDRAIKALVAARILGPRSAIEEAAWAVGAVLDDGGHVQPDLFGGDAA